MFSEPTVHSNSHTAQRNMKHLVLFAAVVAMAMAAIPDLVNQREREVVPIVKQENEISPEGNFHYAFESGDGSRAEEDGVLTKSQDPQKPDSIAVKGTFSYVDTDGQNVQVSYVADETGFHPEGAHLPTPPPVPEAIARALKYIAEHPQPAEPEIIAARRP